MHKKSLKTKLDKLMSEFCLSGEVPIEKCEEIEATLRTFILMQDEKFTKEMDTNTYE